MTGVKITRKQFEQYTKAAGTEFFDIKNFRLTGLSRNKCLHIMRNYKEIKDKFETYQGINDMKVFRREPIHYNRK